jgi:hypothetical protein
VCCAIYPVLIEFTMRPLAETENEFAILLERIRLYNLKHFEMLSKPIRHLVKDLSGNYSGNIEELKVMIVSDDDAYVALEHTIIIKRKFRYLYHAFKFYLFGLYDEAMGCVKNFDAVVMALFGPYRTSFTILIGGLVDVAYARQMKFSRALIAKKYSKVLLRWATVGEPRNFIGSHYFLEAELAALAGKQALSYKLYITAIGTCREGKFMLLTAMATERAARSLFEWGRYDVAAQNFREAIRLYTEWGATKKVQHLQLEILQFGY